MSDSVDGPGVPRGTNPELPGGRALPGGLVLVRTTPEFTEETVPAALLRAHRVAEGVWGRLVVIEGAVEFVFEDEPELRTRLTAGTSIAIPPKRPHRVVLVGPARFAVEFHRSPSAD